MKINNYVNTLDESVRRYKKTVIILPPVFIVVGVVLMFFDTLWVAGVMLMIFAVLFTFLLIFLMIIFSRKSAKYKVQFADEMVQELELYEKYKAELREKIEADNAALEQAKQEKAELKKTKKEQSKK